MSRGNQDVIALPTMRRDQCCDRLWINARVTKWEREYGSSPGDLIERISGHCGERRRGGCPAQRRCNFTRSEARNEDWMCATRPGGLDESR